MDLLRALRKSNLCGIFCNFIVALNLAVFESRIG
jgi:hypothetical protein